MANSPRHPAARRSAPAPVPATTPVPARAPLQVLPPAITHRQLGLFRAIMLQGTLGRAADATGSSQPTLSRELARLEQLLGFALFDRVQGRLRPTVRAMALMDEVERSFIGVEQIAQRALELRTQSGGRLRVACLPALAHALLPQALDHFRRSHPDATVSVVPLESPWLEQALSEQRYDLGLSETAEAPTGVAREALLEANEVAVLPAKHGLCRKPVLQLADFAGQAFISLAEGDPYRQAIDLAFAEAGIERETRLETASAVAVCAMVQQGLGIGIVNPLTAAAMAGPKLTVRPLAYTLPFSVSLLVPQVAAGHPWREALVESLRAASETWHAR